MKKGLRLLVIGSTFLFAAIASDAQNVGIGTATPAQKLEVAGTGNTIRINGLKTGGTYNAIGATTNSNILFVNNSNGDVYSLQSGSNGQVLVIDATTGIPTWETPASTSATAWQLTGNNNGTYGFLPSPSTYLGTTSATAGFQFGVAGKNAGRIESVANGNTALGYQALNIVTNTEQDVAIGYQALGNAPNASGTTNTAIGYQAMYNASIGNDNVAIGYQTLYTNAGSNNTGVGVTALNSTSLSGNNNTAVGRYSMDAVAGGANNTGLGYNSTVSSGALSNATAIGADAVVGESNAMVLGSISGINTASASTSVGIGTETPAQALDVEGGNIQFGQALMPAGIAGVTGNILLSSGANTAPTWLGNGTSGEILQSNGTSSAPTWVTPAAASATAWALTGNSISGPTFTSATTYSNYYVGTTNSTSGGDVPLVFVANGLYVGSIDAYSGTRNVYLGGPQGSGTAGTFVGNKNQGSNNTGIGESALASVVTGTDFNVAVGCYALEHFDGSTPSGTPSVTGVGFSVLQNLTSGIGNEGFGFQAEYELNSGQYNVGVGTDANYTNSTGSDNVAVGDSAMYGAGSFSGSVGIGTSALRANSGSYNTAIGENALVANTTGSNNTAIGHDANVSANNLTFATAIGAGASAVASSSLTLGSSTAGTLYFPAYGSAGTLLYTSATNGLVASTGAGSAGYVLQSNGTNAPTWVSPTTSATAWQLTGNSGTTPSSAAIGSPITAGSNFIGTTDNHDLVFALNNGTSTYERMRIQAASGAIGIDIAPVATQQLTVATATAANIGIVGQNTAASGTSTGVGVEGTSAQSAGEGVLGGNSNTSTGTSSQAAVGVEGYVGSYVTNPVAAWGGPVGVFGVTTLTNGTGVLGQITGTSSNGVAVGALNNATGSNNYAIIAETEGTATGVNYGIWASASGATTNYSIIVPSGGGDMGVGTATPAQTLEVGVNTVRIDALKSGGGYSTGSTASTSNLLFANNSTGDIYALTNGTTGDVLTMTSGAPTWTTPAATSSTAWQLTGNVVGYTYAASSPAAYIGTASGGGNGLEFGVEGANAGRIDNAEQNIALGGESMNSAIGADMTFTVSLGYGSLENATTGTRDVAIGTNAMSTGGSTSAPNGPGSYNVAVGFASLNINTGSENVGVGYQTFRDGTPSAPSNDNGSYGVAIGYDAASSGYTGTYDNFVGANSGYTTNYVISGTGDNGFGANTLYKIQTGNYNDAIGYNSQYNNTTGSNNVAMGYNSSYNLGSYFSNTSIGAWSLYNNNSSHNTAIGDSALFTNTSGEYNTAIGYQANVTSSNLSYATAIGAGASAVAAYSVTLGSASTGILYFPGYEVPGSVLYTAGANGLVGSTGAGTSGQVLQSNFGGAPTWVTLPPATAAWDLTGNASTSPSTNFVGTTDGAALMFRTGLLSNGNSSFGGIIDPVYDNAFFGNNAGDYGNGATNSVAIGYNSGDNNTGADNTFVGYGANVTGGPWTNATAIGYNATVGESNALILGSTGTYVGIGTNTPSQPLYVTETNDNDKYVISASATQPDLSGDPQSVAIYGYGSGSNNFHGYAVGVMGVASPGSHGGVGLYGAIASSVPTLSNVNDFYGVYADASGTTYGTGYAAALMGGNVGVGTATPVQTLEVANGSVRIDALQAGGTYNPLTSAATSTSNILYTNNATGDIYGLANGTSGQILTMSGGVPTWAAAASTSATAWQLTGNAGITNPGAPAVYGTSTIAATTSGANWIGTTDGKDLVVGTDGIERLRVGGGTVATAGNVGVGTSTPNSTLQVQGSVSYAVSLLNIANTPGLTYSIGAGNYLVEADCSSGSFTLTLPNATTCQGRAYVIIRSDATYNSSYVLNIATFSSGQNIGPYTGSTSSAIALGVNYQQESIMSDGTNWVIITSSFN